MPYTVRAAAVASDHAVIAKAIDVWMAVPENAVGLSSPTLDQVKKALADHFNEMFEAAVNARNFEGPGLQTKLFDIIKAARNAFAWHVQNEDADPMDLDNAADFVELKDLNINDPNLQLTWTQTARFYFALTKILLVSSALSLEDAVSMVNAAMVYQATAVGELDNRHEVWLGYVGMFSSFLLWVTDWHRNGSPRVEWREASDCFEKASVVIKHVGFLFEQASLGALSYYGSVPNASAQITVAGGCLLAATVLKHNKAVVLQVRKGIDVSFKLVLVLLTLVIYCLVMAFAGTGQGFAGMFGYLGYR